MRRHKHFGNSLSTVNFDIYDSLFLFLWQFIPARMRAERILFCCLLLDQSPQLHSYLNDRKSDCLLLWRWRSQIYSSFEGLRLELKFRTGQFKRLIECRQDGVAGHDMIVLSQFVDLSTGHTSHVSRHSALALTLTSATLPRHHKHPGYATKY